MRLKNATGANPIIPIAPHLERAQNAARSSAADTADEAGISPGARELARAREAVDAAPETREMRVKALRAAIREGTYKPDAGEVARKLLERGF